MQKIHERWARELAPLYPQVPLVPGEGAALARLMLIGEAPGKEEALQGRPFVGKAGKNLDEFLRAIGLAREEIYITNVVKIRPSKMSSKGTLSNRPPTAAEVRAFLPWLSAEIQCMEPRLIVPLGNTPLQALLGKGMRIGDVHGKWLAAQGADFFPLYHPAAIIYNRALKDVYQEDLQTLRAELAQRGLL